MVSDDLQFQQLLDALLDSHSTPEAVCKLCPELLPVVRDRWLELRRLRADLDVLFPPSDGSTPKPPEETALPQIPGYEVEAGLGHGGLGGGVPAKRLLPRRPGGDTMMARGGAAGHGGRDPF